MRATERTLCVLVLMWVGPAVWAGPVRRRSTPQCDSGCMQTSSIYPSFQHISKLSRLSVAPWTLVRDKSEAGREPGIITHARCENCSDTSLKSQPIMVQVYVNKFLSANVWCRCPYQLAVGCTCIPRSA